MKAAGDPTTPLWFVVLDDDAGWLQQLHDMCADHPELRCAGGTSRAEDVPRLVRDNGAEMVLVEHRLAARPGLAVAAELVRRLPAVRVYLMAESPTRELWEDARRQGIRGVVKKPFDAPGLAARIREDLEVEARVLAGMQPPTPPPSPALGPGTEGPGMLSFFSCKGGVGKSLVATSLALATGGATARRRRSVVVVDAEEGVGSIPTLLGVPPRPTLLDWADWRGERFVDPGIAASRLAQTRYGVGCLFAPGEMDLTVDGPLMETILATLARMAAVTMVDCAPSVSAAVLVALRMSTTVILVCEPSLDCLERTRKGVQALATAGIGIAKFRVLVNVTRQGAGDYSPAEVRAALGLQVLGALPFDPTAKRAANRRRPLAVEAPRGPFMVGLCRAFAGLLPGLGERGGTGRLWPRLE